ERRDDRRPDRGEDVDAGVQVEAPSVPRRSEPVGVASGSVDGTALEHVLPPGRHRNAAVAAAVDAPGELLGEPGLARLRELLRRSRGVGSLRCDAVDDVLLTLEQTVDPL